MYRTSPSLSTAHHTPAVRFGQLSKEERKAVAKTTNKRAFRGGVEHTHICNSEIGKMLVCFEANSWATEPCMPQITAMYACVEEHKGDPDPKILAQRWQNTLKRQVFAHFSRAKVMSRLAR